MNENIKIFLYGQSGAGKSTLAREIARRWPNFVMVDGDEIRKETGNYTYGRGGRYANVNAGVDKARHLSNVGRNVVCSFMAPYEQMRRMIRRDLSGVIMVYLYYDKEQITRGREQYWATDFEQENDFDISINTGLCSEEEALRVICEAVEKSDKKIMEWSTL